MFNISETGVCGDGGGGSGGGGLVTRSCLILVILWTVACQAPLSMRLPRQEYWNGLPFSSPGDLPTQGSNPGLLYCRRPPALQVDFSFYQLHHQWPYLTIMLRNSHWPWGSPDIVGIAFVFVNIVITIWIVIISLSSMQFNTTCVKTIC